jgi:arabinofuranosyltransferase
VSAARRSDLAIVGLLVTLFAVVLVRNAWLADDAYISFRTVDNFVSGHGLRWNVDERVQGFTHPLWLLLCSLAYALTHEIYYTVLALQIAISLAVVAIILRAARDRWTVVLAAMLLLVSKPFVDYSTSGLENPLAHLLLLAFLVAFARDDGTPRSLFAVSLAAALVVLNRMDHGLLVLPALAYRFLQRPRLGHGLAVAAGLLPVAAWSAFALFYYGSAIPNTAYAKLNTGLSAADLVPQGLRYLLDFAKITPVTAVVLVLGIVACLRPGARQAVFGASLLLYLAYVVRVGGDFMSGRFLTAPFVLAFVVLLEAAAAVPVRTRWSVAVALIILGLAWPRSPVWSGKAYGTGPERVDEEWGIVDERAIYFQSTGLLNAGPPRSMPRHPWADEGRRARAVGDPVVSRMGIGFFGFCAGPGVHVVDGHALTDPLLARLPANTRKGWHIGHFYRMVPDGYLETLRTGRNQIADPDLAAYYDRLALVIRGPLADRERLRSLWLLGTGGYDHYIRSWDERRLRERERRLKFAHPG